MYQGREPRACGRVPRRDRREIEVEADVARLEADWHRAERDAPERALRPAVALADALVAVGRQRAAASVLARALRGAPADDPALPHAGLRLGDLAFVIGHLDDSARGYERAIGGGVATVRARARHGLFLATRAQGRAARRHLSAALLEPEGAGEIATAARMLLHAAETGPGDDAPQWAHGALEGFRMVRDDEREERARALAHKFGACEVDGPAATPVVRR